MQQRAWGIYVLDPSETKLLVDVPHTRADLHATLQAIVSSGTSTASMSARSVHMQLIKASVTSCLYRSAGCQQLGATQNVQGHETRKAGGDFVHVEPARALRTDQVARGRAAQAIAAGLDSAAGCPVATAKRQAVTSPTPSQPPAPSRRSSHA
jgi:hypothetical protein